MGIQENMVDKKIKSRLATLHQNYFSHQGSYIIAWGFPRPHQTNCYCWFSEKEAKSAYKVPNFKEDNPTTSQGRREWNHMKLQDEGLLILPILEVFWPVEIIFFASLMPWNIHQEKYTQ